MSGQPYRYSTDQAKYRAEYMKNLQERIDLDDMVLQAVKGYVSNGTLPAISQMTDTRTTAEKLLDIQKLKQDLIKDLAPIMDPQIADRFIQGLTQSPLNSDNRLVVFFSQRAPEIVTNLQKLYKYGIKGDMNDITVFVDFVNNMYLEKNKAVGSIKSFIDRSGTSGLSMTSKDDLLNLKVSYSNFMADLLRKVRPTGAEGNMIDDIGDRLDMLLQYMPSTIQMARVYELIKDPTDGGVRPDVDYFRFYGPLDNMIDFMNTSLPNKNILDQLNRDFQNLTRPINKASEEEYIEREGTMTRKGYRKAEVKRTVKIETATMDLLTRLAGILPTTELLQSIFTPEIMDFLRKEVVIQDIAPSGETDKYIVKPYRFGEKERKQLPDTIQEEGDEEMGKRTFTKTQPGEDPELMLHRPGQSYGSTTPQKVINIPIIAGTKPLPQQQQQTSQEPENFPEIDDILKTLRALMIGGNDLKKYMEMKPGGDLSINQIEDRTVRGIEALKINIDRLLEQVKNVSKQDLLLGEWNRVKDDELIRAQLDAVKELMKVAGYMGTVEGFGFKKKRRGRPRGTGFKQNIESHIDTQKGIQPDFRFSKFGKYLIRNDHLMDNTVSIRTGKGLNITGLPSTKTNPRVVNIIKKIIGGALPSFDEMSKLTEDEKAYLHKISKKSNILEKVNIPTPSKDKEEKEFNEFEILRGEIMAGNDNKDMVRKFKGFLIRFSKTGQLPKQQVNEILQDMLDMNL